MLEKIRAVMFGHAVADALGVPVEFEARARLDAAPVTDMRGFGTYPYPAGCWSDDTSMSLAALDSLAGGRLNWTEIMDNFGAWYYRDAYTPTGKLFDVGITCSRAIENYAAHGKSPQECGLTEDSANGNGSLMRIHPFVLYLHARNYLRIQTIHEASALTHGHKRSQIGCGIYAFVLRELLRNPEKASVVRALRQAKKYYAVEPENCAYDALYRMGASLETCAATPREGIKSGGYVVHTLEAAIWCLLTTDSYRACVLKAVNLGEDTDTVAAVAGGLAGALYGYEAIPAQWLAQLKKREEIDAMCRKASNAWGAQV